MKGNTQLRFYLRLLIGLFLFGEVCVIAIDLYYYYFTNTTVLESLFDVAVFTVLYAAVLVPTFLIIRRGLTTVHMSEEALRESEEKYRIITDNITDAVWLMDMNMKYTWISPSVTKLRGFTLEELTDMPIEEDFTPESVPVALKALADTVTPENPANKDARDSVSIELEFYKKYGGTFWAEVDLKLLRDDNGNQLALLGVSHDITDRRISEELTEKHARELSEVISIAGHELRHPISILFGYTEILLDSEGDLGNELVHEALTGITHFSHPYQYLSSYFPFLTSDPTGPDPRGPRLTR